MSEQNKKIEIFHKDLQKAISNFYESNEKFNISIVLDMIINMSLLKKNIQIIEIIKLFFPTSKLLIFLKFWREFCKNDYEKAFIKIQLFLTSKIIKINKIKLLKVKSAIILFWIKKKILKLLQKKYLVQFA